MTPDYIRMLADLADPHELWRMPVLSQRDLPAALRQQLDTGVALRRYAAHLAELAFCLEQKKSLLITSLDETTTAVKYTESPPDHEKLRSLR